MTNNLQKLPAPADGKRVESGPVQFGEDWPGVFFRGDNAAMIASTLAGFVASGLDEGRTSNRDFVLYGLLIGHAGHLAECDLTGVVSGGVNAIRAKLEAAAKLADAPTSGGVQ